MQSSKISFSHSNGTIEGVYINAGDNTPLIIIANGHNGFYNYGMFPYIQSKLGESGVSSYSFNYSHGGVKGDEDFFSELEKYEKNCMRLEKEDILCALENLQSDDYKHHSSISIFTHSLGGVPTIFATVEAQELKLKLNSIILTATIKTLDVWGDTMMKKWQEDGVYLMKNKRTNQDLPQGYEFLQEVLKSNTDWNVETAIKKIQLPTLIVHGEKDEAVPVEHSKTLFEWVQGNNPQNELNIITDATHNFNTKHPFEGTSPELDNMVLVCVDWVKKFS